MTPTGTNKVESLSLIVDTKKKEINSLGVEYTKVLENDTKITIDYLSDKFTREFLDSLKKELAQ